MKFYKTADGIIDLDDIEVKLELVTPEIAKNYLSCNFKNNRILRKPWVKELSLLIKKQEFNLSWDCISFDEEGILVNGQHRLNAVIEANLPAPFFIAKNLPHVAAQQGDNGKKRTQSERITVGGTVMKRQECSAIKNAICELNTAYTGTYLYGLSRYDKLITEVYKKHSKYFNELDKINYLRNKYTSPALAVALKIFVEMAYRPLKRTYKHNQNAFDRSIFWLDLFIDGYSERFTINKETDLAPLVARKALKHKRDNRRATWDIETLKLAIKAGHLFMRGSSVKRINTNYETDPFTSFKTLPSTNKYSHSNSSHIIAIKKFNEDNNHEGLIHF
jgi:hypothetical protein